MRALRADIVIATLALLLSAGATISSLYQTKVIANQLSSSVWPYVTIGSTVFPNSYSLYVVNDGLGPALVRSVDLAIDGKRIANYHSGIRAFAASRRIDHSNLNISFSSIGPTTVIRPGDKHMLIAITGAAVVKLGDISKRASLSMCYCSILDQCWNVTQSEDKAREQVASCTAHDELVF